MESLLLEVKTLPLPIRRILNTPKVSVQQLDGNIVLIPINEGSGLLGIAANDNLTVDKLRTYKNEVT